MESFGKKLTEARVARGLEFEQVARETNITRRYLEALEAEDFSAFPGEPYLLGFLRNYCDYLGLNSNEFISAYKNLKIQESPVPLKDLIPRRNFSDLLFSNPVIGKMIGAAIAAAILIGIGVGSYGFFGKMMSDMNKGEEIAVREAVDHQIGDVEFQGRVFAGDSLTVTVGGVPYRMTVIASAPAVKLETPAGMRVIELAQDMLLDLDGEGTPDAKIFVADLFRDDPSKGATLHVSAGNLVEPGQTVAGVLGENTATGDAAAAAEDVVVPQEPNKPGETTHLVLFEGGSAYPVTLNATFRGYCLFRFEADKTNREERYYQKSELLTVQAKNGFRVWASNGNAVKIQMVAGGKTVDLELSRPGEVLVRDLKWIKDEESGRFKFIVQEVD